MNHVEHRVRERAYHIWLNEGKPEGRADLHWEMAAELVAVEENPDLMPEPNRSGPGEATLTDPGEEANVPLRRARKPAAAKSTAADAPAKPAAKRMASAAKAATKDATAVSKPSADKRAKPK